jgi:hypothetical protein
LPPDTVHPPLDTFADQRCRCICRRLPPVLPSRRNNLVNRNSPHARCRPHHALLRQARQASRTDAPRDPLPPFARTLFPLGSTSAFIGLSRRTAFGIFCLTPCLATFRCPFRRAAMSWKERLPNLVSGGLGGIAPPVIALAIDLAYRHAHLPEWSFWLGVLLFFVIGAGVVHVFAENVGRKAFFLGLGLPALVHGSIQDASGVPGLTTGLLNVSRSAYAEMISPPGQRVILAPNAGMDQPYNVDILSAEGSPIGSVHVGRPDQLNMLTLPEGSSYLRLQSQSSESIKIPLTGGPAKVTGFKIGLEETPWSGLRRALGFRNVKPYQFSVTPDVNVAGNLVALNPDASTIQRNFSIDTFQ